MTALSTFMGGLSFVGLILSVNILTGKARPETMNHFLAESVIVIFLLAAIVLFLTSAVTLASAYFESGVGKETGMRRARRMNVPGTILTFWAVAALMLVAFDFTEQAVLYAVAGFVAPLAFVFGRRIQGIPL